MLKKLGVGGGGQGGYEQRIEVTVTCKIAKKKLRGVRMDANEELK